VDLSISRDFSLSHFREGMHIQLRADAYNVFNIVSLNSPSGMEPPWQFHLRPNYFASAMRQLQLGLRFTF